MGSITYNSKKIIITKDSGAIIRFSSDVRFFETTSGVTLQDSLFNEALIPSDYGYANKTELLNQIENAYCAVKGFGRMSENEFHARLKRTKSSIVFDGVRYFPKPTVSFETINSGTAIILEGDYGDNVAIYPSELSSDLPTLQVWLDESILESLNSIPNSVTQRGFVLEDNQLTGLSVDLFTFETTIGKNYLAEIMILVEPEGNQGPKVEITNGENGLGIEYGDREGINSDESITVFSLGEYTEGVIAGKIFFKATSTSSKVVVSDFQGIGIIVSPGSNMILTELS